MKRSAILQRADSIFVVGGSAGSIEPLKSLLCSTPKNFKIAIACCIHLPAGHKSLLPQIFRDICSVNVKEAESTEEIVSGTIYFAPPDYHLCVEKDLTFSLSSEEPRHFSRPSIDILFESAADAYGPRCAGLLLSGANEDGAEGLKKIKSLGGRTFIQDPDLSEHPTMPASARLKFVPDGVISPRELNKMFIGSEIGALI